MPIRARLTTVLAGAVDTALVDIDVVMDELDIDEGAEDDSLPFLIRAIARASAAAAQYCNRVFAVETVRDEFWPWRDPAPAAVPGRVEPLQLTRWPAIVVNSVIEDGVALVANTDYRLDPKAAQLVRLDSTADSYPRAWRAVPIAVEYSAGFATVPADLEEAVVRMVKARWLTRTADPTIKSENILEGLYSYSRFSPAETNSIIPADVAPLLDAYRVPVIG